MIKNIFINSKLKSILPALVVLMGLSVASVISYGFYLMNDRDGGEVVVEENLNELEEVFEENIGETEAQYFSDEVAVLHAPRPTVTAGLIETLPASTPTPTPDDTTTSTPTSATKSKSKSESEATPYPTPEPTPKQQPEKSKISLTMSIDGGSSFSLSIDEGKNHCEALEKAKIDGKIASLNMKYDSSLGSYGVFQINDVGVDGQVWWVYEVNDKKVPLGCSHTEVKDGDSVKWKYLGPR